MYLGHETSERSNVHPLDELAAEHGQEPIPQVRYPPQAAVERYYAMAKPDRAVPEDHVATAIFVGQVPNMLPLPYLAWAIDAIAGRYVVECVRHARKSGCAIAFVRRGESERLYERSRKVLFDVIGFWAPATPEQETRLTDYTAMLRGGAFTKVHKDGRIPKSCMVFEELGRPRQATQGAPELGHLQLRDRHHQKGAAQQQHQQQHGHHQHSGNNSTTRSPPVGYVHPSENGSGGWGNTQQHHHQGRGHHHHQSYQQQYSPNQAPYQYTRNVHHSSNGNQDVGHPFGRGASSAHHGGYGGGGGEWRPRDHQHGGGYHGSAHDSGGGYFSYDGSGGGGGEASWDDGDRFASYGSWDGAGDSSQRPSVFGVPAMPTGGVSSSLGGHRSSSANAPQSGGTPLLPLSPGPQPHVLAANDDGNDDDEAMRQRLSFVAALVE